MRIALAELVFSDLLYARLADRVAGGKNAAIPVRIAVLGSTSGIGRAVALALAGAGADVIVHGRSQHEAAAPFPPRCAAGAAGRTC